MISRPVLCLVSGLAALAVALPAQAQEVDAIIKKLQQTKSISIGHREASVPHSYLDNSQKPVGYSVDLCLKVVDAVKEELKIPDIAVKWVPVNIQNRMALVSNGTVDIECGSTVNTLARQKQVDFTYVTFIAADQMMVRRNSGIKEIEDLNGKVVAVPQASTSEKVVNELIAAKKFDARVVQIRDHADALLSLESNRIDAYLTDNIILYGLVSKARNPADYVVTGRMLSYAPYGMMVPKNNPTFLAIANRTFARMFRSGEIEPLYTKWFNQVGFPLTDEVKAAFKIQAIPE
jgi:glutamate/aspartate transport system substrate-binding protein